MSLIDSRSNKDEKGNRSAQSTTEEMKEHSPVNQLPFPAGPTVSAEPQVAQLDFSSSPLNQSVAEPVTPAEGMTAVSHTSPLSGANQQRADLMLTPAVTQHLAHTGALAPIAPTSATSANTNAQRQPVLIRGTGTKSVGMIPPRGGTRARVITHLSVATLLVVVLVGALMTFSPIGHGQGGLNIFQSSSNTAKTSGKNASLISQQAATATAVTQDGFDSGTNTGQYGSFVPVAPTGANQGGLGRFFYGQCTYWANMRYHQLTGVWVPWLGNAWEWSSQAAAYGWTVSSTPKVPSIIVLQPYVQGAGGYGHVAIVESINKDGSVVTSNWNWAGGWATTTYVTFYPGSGVSFVWAPGH